MGYTLQITIFLLGIKHDKTIKIIEIDGIQFWKRDAKLKCFRSAVKRRKSQLAMVRQRQRDQLPEGTISISRDTRDRLQETFPKKPFVSGGSPNIPKMTKIWPIHVWVHFNCWIGCLVQCVSMCWKEYRNIYMPFRNRLGLPDIQIIHSK